MEFPLQIRYCTERPHNSAGVLIPGSDTAKWVAVASHLDVPTSQICFLPVHEMIAGQPHTLGALAVVPGRNASFNSIPDKCCLVYGCRIERVYLPEHSELIPAITDAELEDILPGDFSRVFVWHPVTGLIGYDPEQIRSATDLLTAPAVSANTWDCAETSEQLNLHIRSLQPEGSPESDDVVDRGQDDIGTESDRIEDAPRAPDEKSMPALRDGINSLKSGISNAVNGIHKFMNSIFGGGEGSKKGAHPPPSDPGISTRRENQIKRLLNLLRNDPDTGLKFAPPIGSENRSRGLAPPGDRLAEHEIDFDPSRLFGSGRGDVWQLPWEYQVQLLQEYRQLAQREQRLGRYRRAAYIYAKLLHDLPSAAEALKAGHYYHDAATIYIQHLHDPLKAAECLRTGGFWEEAVQIYKNNERWMAAGELYAEIDRPDDAREMFHIEIEVCRRRNDYSTAGVIADQNLEDVDLARELYLLGWSKNTHARKCLRQLFQLYGRRGLHDDATGTLNQVMSDQQLRVTQLEDAVSICSENSTAYPDESVRSLARQHTFRIAAELLSELDPTCMNPGRSAALAAIRRIEPNDRLLHTDSQRYEMQARLRDASQTTRSKPTLKFGTRPAQILECADHTPEGSLQGTQWLEVISNGQFIFRCGKMSDGRTVAVRQAVGTRRDGRIVTEDRIAVLPATNSHPAEFFSLRINRRAPDRVWILPRMAMGDWSAEHSIRRALAESRFLMTSPSGIDMLVDLFVSPAGWMFCTSLVIAEASVEFDLHVVNSQNLNTRTVRLQSAWDEANDAGERPFCRVYSDGSTVFLANGRTVWRVDESITELTELTTMKTAGTALIEKLPHLPVRMVASPNNTTTRLVFSFEEGARAIWPVDGSGCAVATELASPVTTFTDNGVLAAACQQTGRLEFYRLTKGRANLFSAVSLQSGVHHMTIGPAPNQVLAFHDDGRISQVAFPFN